MHSNNKNKLIWTSSMGFCWIKLTCWVFFSSLLTIYDVYICAIWKISRYSVWCGACVFNENSCYPTVVSCFSFSNSLIILADQFRLFSQPVYWFSRTKKNKPNALITISFGAASVLGPFSITTRSNGIVSCWNNICIGLISCRASTIGASPNGAYQSIVAHNQIWWIFNLNRSIWYLRVLSQIARDTQYRWPESMT